MNTEEIKTVSPNYKKAYDEFFNIMKDLGGYLDLKKTYENRIATYNDALEKNEIDDTKNIQLEVKLAEELLKSTITRIAELKENLESAKSKLLYLEHEYIKEKNYEHRRN